MEESTEIEDCEVNNNEINISDSVLKLRDSLISETGKPLFP